jgi:uncharacterized protein (TIGR00159 family)
MNELFELRTLRLVDVIDVAVVSVFVYGVISWVRRARSRFVLLGLAALVALYFAARLLRMYLTLFLFQVGLTVAVVTLVVIFQEDIRRGFERLATARLLRQGRPQAGTYDLIATIVRAATTLGQRRVGALLVFKGKEPLERHIVGGIALDGRLSEPLLYSIFDPSSEGHDGAVVVEGGLVTKFAGHLPLSSQEGTQRGTRHTAALGLSERSDALIVVVSEERGTVSVAHGGRLTETVTPEELTARLTEFFERISPQNAANASRRAFSRNFGTKLASVAIACAAWFVVVDQQAQTSARTVMVPVVYEGLPKGLWLDDPPVREASVTLTGTRRSLGQLPETLVATVDVSQVVPGQQRLPIAEGQLNLPAGVELSSVEPPAVTLTVYRSATVEVPIKPDLVGHLPPGKVLGKVTVEPANLVVEVRRRDQNHLDSIPTTPIDIGDLDSTQRQVQELLIPPKARLVRGQPTAVSVTLPVTSARTEAP